MRDSDLDKLLRAAAAAPADLVDEMPFGFDTRVVAQWRATRAGSEWRSFAPMLRWIALGATAIVLSAGSAWWQVQQEDEFEYPAANTYAIADTAIEANTW